MTGVLVLVGALAVEVGALVAVLAEVHFSEEDGATMLTEVQEAEETTVVVPVEIQETVDFLIPDIVEVEVEVIINNKDMNPIGNLFWEICMLMMVTHMVQIPLEGTTVAAVVVGSGESSTENV